MENRNNIRKNIILIFVNFKPKIVARLIVAAYLGISVQDLLTLKINNCNYNSLRLMILDLSIDHKFLAQKNFQDFGRSCLDIHSYQINHKYFGSEIDHRKRRYLRFACMAGNLEMVQYLVPYMQSVSFGMSMACQTGHLYIAKYLYQFVQKPCHHCGRSDF